MLLKFVIFLVQAANPKHQNSHTLVSECFAFWKNKAADARHSLLEDNLGSSFAVHAEAAIRHFNDRAHGLPHGVEGVNFVELLLGDEAPDGLVILLQIQDKPQEATLRLIAHLARQPALFFWWLERRKKWRLMINFSNNKQLDNLRSHGVEFKI